MTAPQLAYVPPVDTLGFSLTEERQVVNDTVRITARVHAQREPGISEAALRSEMRQALRAFVDAPDWQLSPARRETQPTGVETITVTASVRVSETENHALKERADRASRPGLTLSGPSADLAIPTDILQATESEIRRALLARASAEARALSGAEGIWVVHAMQFGVVAPASGRDMFAPAFAMRAALPGGPQKPALPVEDDMASNAARMSMTATVTLRRVEEPTGR